MYTYVYTHLFRGDADRRGRPAGHLRPGGRRHVVIMISSIRSSSSSTTTTTTTTICITITITITITSIIIIIVYVLLLLVLFLTCYYYCSYL